MCSCLECGWEVGCFWGRGWGGEGICQVDMYVFFFGGEEDGKAVSCVMCWDENE